ncbi:MAG UNVERIFIED_CONTAM: hypothetical protein LVR18_03990 [Planctomycetaceae bacterium]|jgi:hypothetical protein
MATADKPHSPLTVESTPLLVDATAAAALCGKHLRTWRAWWATGRRSDPEADPTSPFADVEIQ